jgi:hypothetical protein
MARIRFGDQISPQVSRVALGGAATIQNLADVDTNTVGLDDGFLLVYNSATKRFQTSNILNNVIVNGGSF